MSTATPGGVQSVNRALDVLEFVAGTGAAGVAEVAAAAELPAPTTHRLLRTLLDRGYVRQLPDRSYALGFRLVPLGQTASLMVGEDARPILSELVSELGETANLAALVGDQAEYVAQVPARYSMRMFTEVGRRVDLHSTGVGKALLAVLPQAKVDEIVHRRGLTPSTEHTISTAVALRAELDRIRAHGYALDEQEQELGVRCVAMAVPTAPQAWLALSVSGPLTRMTEDVVSRAVPLLRSAGVRLAERLADAEPPLTQGSR